MHVSNQIITNFPPLAPFGTFASDLSKRWQILLFFCKEGLSGGWQTLQSLPIQEFDGRTETTSLFHLDKPKALRSWRRGKRRTTQGRRTGEGPF